MFAFILIPISSQTCSDWMVIVHSHESLFIICFIQQHLELKLINRNVFFNESVEDENPKYCNDYKKIVFEKI